MLNEKQITCLEEISEALDDPEASPKELAEMGWEDWFPELLPIFRIKDRKDFINMLSGMIEADIANK